MKNVLILPGTVLLTTSLAAGQATDPVVYDNGPNAGGGASSQLDTVYPFDSQVADDFILGGNYTITGMTWYGVFWNGSPITVPAWNLLIYNDDGSGVRPTGGPLDPTPTAILNSQEGVVFHNGVDQWSTDLTTTISLNAGTQYWVAIQAEHTFPPQWGWSQSLSQTGATAVQGFPLLGINYWDGAIAGDMAFQLHGVATPAPGALALLGLAGLVARRQIGRAHV